MNARIQGEPGMSDKRSSGKYVTAALLALFALGLFLFTVLSGLR